MKISLISTISGIRTLADQTIRVQVDLNETSPEQIAELFRLKGGYGHFLFAEQAREIDTSNLPKIVLEEDERSPATRLRGSLFRLHEKNGGKREDFDGFYKKQMERFIEAVKEKLN